MRLFKEDSGDSLINNGARSEYTKKYPEHPIDKRRPYKPPHEILSADVPIESVTSQKRDFPEHPIARRAAYRPDQGRVDLDPFDGHTTNREEYPEWQLPEKQVRERVNWVAPVEPIQTVTSQKHDYQEHQVQKREAYKPDSFRPNLDRFDGQASYRDNFPEWQLPEKHQRQQALWQAPTVPMDSATTNNNVFMEHQVSPRVQHKPNNLPVASEVPFMGSSDYNDTYKEHAVQPRHMRQKAEWTRPTESLDTTTTMQKDFQGAYQPRQASMRPYNAPISSDVPLDSDTTAATSYRAHQIEPRLQAIRRQNMYEPPEGNMETMTTNMANYREHALSKPHVIKPSGSQIMMGRGEIARDTTTNSHYTVPPPMKRDLMKAKHEYSAPTVPMDSNTTAGMNYIQHEITPRKNFRPDGGYMKTDVPFQDSTENKDGFTQKALPARYIHQKEQHKPPSASFDGRTTTNQSYIGAYQQRRDAFRPDQDPIHSDVPFQGDTTTGTSYQPHQAEQRFRHQADKYIKPEGFMDMNTTNSLAYKEVRGERPSMRKLGDSSLLTMAGRFQDTTSYSNDFVPKDMSNRKLIRPDNEYHAPTQPFDNSTTYRNSHLGYSQPKERSMRPGNLTDVLGQRDQGNKYHIRGHDWREMVAQQETVVI